MGQHQRRQQGIAIVLAIVVVAALLAVIGSRGFVAQQGYSTVPKSGQGGTDTPTPGYQTYGSRVMTARAAISLTLQAFPRGHPSQSPPIAKLLPYSQIDSWRSVTSIDTNPDDPAWLVGIRGDNLSVGDIFSDLSQFTPSNAATVADGAYYIWDARTGYLAGVGVLQQQGALSYDWISGLSSVSMAIERATELSPYPTGTPLTPGAPTETPW